MTRRYAETTRSIRSAALCWILVALAALVGCEPEPPPAPPRTEVWFDHERDDWRAVARQVHDPSFARAVFLPISGIPIGDVGYAALARSPYLGGLERLSLLNSDMTNLGLAALSAARDLTPKDISLGIGTFDHRGWSLLLQSPILSSTTSLHVVGAAIGDTGAIELSRSPQAESLVDLTISSWGLTRRGLAAILTSRRLGALESLDISELELNLSAFEHLQDPTNLPLLRKLVLPNHRLPQATKAAIVAARPGLIIIEPHPALATPGWIEPAESSGDRPDVCLGSPSTASDAPAAGAASRPERPSDGADRRQCAPKEAP